MEALRFFHWFDAGVLENRAEFNKREIRKRYKSLALWHHEDRPTGENENWLLLCSYFGILNAMCDERDGADEEAPDEEQADMQSLSLLAHAD